MIQKERIIDLLKGMHKPGQSAIYIKDLANLVVYTRQLIVHLHDSTERSDRNKVEFFWKVHARISGYAAVLAEEPFFKAEEALEKSQQDSSSPDYKLLEPFQEMVKFLLKECLEYLNTVDMEIEEKKKHNWGVTVPTELV